MSGRIPQQFIDELLSRVDIVDVIDARLRLKKAGRDYQALCPFHDEKSPSFTVSQDKQFYHCFGCGAHGSAIGFLMEYDHMDFIEAVETLAGQAGMEVPREAARVTASGHETIYEIMEQAAQFYRRQLRDHPAASTAIGYLKGRGLTGEIVKRFGIGFAPPGWDNLIRALDPAAKHRADLAKAGLIIDKQGGGHYDRFRDRIIFPIRDRRGRVIGFGGRVLGDDKPKYLNSPETPIFHKGRELYGYYEARKSEGKLERLLVVEGYMDVVALAQFGIHNAVATLGTATTPEHLETLFRTVPEVVFCFDGDRAGRAAAWKALETALPVIREGREARFLFLPEGEDPDTLVRKEGRETFQARTENAVPLSRFFFQELAKKVDIYSVDGRARLVELARPLLAKLPDGVYRELMMDELGQMVHMDRISLAGYLRPDKPKAEQRPSARSRQERTTPSPIRHAITLVLHKPALAAKAGDPKRFHSLRQPGIPLLIQLLEIAQTQPHLNTGALLERWRGEEEMRHLVKLASTRLPVPDEGLEAEFTDTLARLDNLLIEQRAEQLLAKLAHEGLTEEEKHELQRALSHRH